MCKTTTGTQTAASPNVVRTATRTGTGGGGGGPGPGADPEASTAGPIFGEPDYAPQHTFITHATPTDNGFIALANTFHQNSGLAPKTVSSVEQILDLLKDNTQTGSGIVNRIRLVSHVFFDPSGQGNPTNMMLPFLNGGVRPSLRRHFEGFAGTSIQGLRSMMTFEVGTFTNTTIFLYRDDASHLMNALRPAQNAILASVPTDSLGEPTGDFRDFFLLCGSKWALRQNALTNAAAKAALGQAYDLVLADVVSRLRSTIPETQLNTLRDAILALGGSHVANTQTPFDPANYATNLNAALTAIQGNAFLNKLNAVRQRFNQNSKVDIRGCQVGREPEYLQAIQRFFGTNTTVRPTVSGPRWFQHFNMIGNITGLQDNARVVQLFNSGFAPYSAAQMQGFLNDWATGFGITAAHLTFWASTLGSDALTFAALAWRGSIPSTTVPVPRLQALASANFRDVIGKLANIFLTAAADRPNAAALNALDPLAANFTTWATQLNANVPDSSTAAQLTTRFNELKTIYENVDNRFGSGSPPSAAQRVIPASPPATLTAQVIRDFQTQLKNFIDTHANSKLRPIKRFITAAHAHAQDPPARMRYFLALGLPFLAFNPASTNSNDNTLIAFTDNTGTDRRQNDAIKLWIRAHWRGLIPSGLGNGTTFDASRHTPWLVERHQPAANLTLSPFTVSPTTDFHDKIVILNP
jgi:hypothetical protein